MTQFTDEQQQRMIAVSDRVGTKLQALFDTLPADEQAALAIALRVSPRSAAGHADDTAGYTMRPEDCIEAVTRGVAEAVAQADVSGHAVMIGGFWWVPAPDDSIPSWPPQIPESRGPTVREPLPPPEPRGPRPGRFGEL